MLSSQTVTIFYYVLCDLTMLSNHTASQAVTVISGFPLLMTSFLSTLPSQAVTTLVIILFFDSSEFQSTLPSQAVTSAVFIEIGNVLDFNPHCPRRQ